MKNRILVIEDEAGIRDNIHMLLEAEGYEVLLAANGETGIKIAFELTPDLIICDIMMPVMDGYEVIRQIQLDNKTRTIPFIFLTARVERSDLRTGMELGADDYIFKPFDAEELLSAIRTRLIKYENIKVSLTSRVNEKGKLEYHDKIMVQHHDGLIPIFLGDILYITAERQYSSVFSLSSKKFVFKRSLTQWEKILPDSVFVRVHRGTIVNLEHVRKIQKHGGSGYVVYLKNSDVALPISRRYYHRIKKH
ncbi:MAG: response regulator [Ignavibacteria bacterium]|nr:response regulator [Ignavibacteria bacterium]